MPLHTVEELSKLYSTPDIAVNVYIPTGDVRLFAVIHVKGNITSEDVETHLHNVFIANNLAVSDSISVFEIIRA